MLEVNILEVLITLKGKSRSLEVHGRGMVMHQSLLGLQVDPPVVVIWSSFCPALCVLPLLERTDVTLDHTLLAQSHFN